MTDQIDSMLERIEALEASTKQLRIDHLRLANTCAGMADDRLEFFSKLLPEEEGKFAAQYQDSLVERVVMAITRDGEPARWDEARAAMLEIAEWLQTHAGGTRACWLLEREAKR